MLLNCGVGEDSWESLGLQGDPTSLSWRRSALGVHWWDWCWSWNSNTLATSWEQLTHWKRPWCWEGLGAGGEGDDRGWDDWMASPTQWAWVWLNSRSLWWTGRPGMLQFLGSQSQTWLSNWTDLNGNMANKVTKSSEFSIKCLVINISIHNDSLTPFYLVWLQAEFIFLMNSLAQIYSDSELLTLSNQCSSLGHFNVLGVIVVSLGSGMFA